MYNISIMYHQLLLFSSELFRDIERYYYQRRRFITQPISVQTGAVGAVDSCLGYKQYSYVIETFAQHSTKVEKNR